MAHTPDAPTQDLTIYLLKEKIKDVDSALRAPISPSLRHFVIKAPAGTSIIGDLFVRPPRAHPPKWAEWFDGYVDLSQMGRVASTAAVLIIKTNQRLFAITFGMGRSLMAPDCWEERFGLRVGEREVSA